MDPRYIILHHSLTKDGFTVSWPVIRKYHVETLGWRDIGYHFGIELVREDYGYEALVGRPWTAIGAHTRFLNDQSLGICFIGNFDKAEPPEAQWMKGVDLVQSLLRVFDLPVSAVKGHRDFATYKSCPGKFFDLDRFRRYVAA